MNVRVTPPPQGLSRRQLLAVVGTGALGLPMAARAQEGSTIKLCQSTTLTGPLGELGQAIHQGAKIGFATINARGGIGGRTIELETRDDGYDVKRALANVTDFLADRQTFALFNCFGTPLVEAMLPQVIAVGVPFFAPLTGSEFPQARTARNFFTVRAGYNDEAAKTIQHLATLGIRRIGIAYQNNPFGEQVIAAAQAAMTQYGVTATATVAVEPSGADAASAAAKLVDSQPTAVLVGLAGQSAVDFIKALRAKRRGLPLSALSVMSTPAMLKAIGSDAAGLSFSQVVPPVNNRTVPVVRDFLQAWKEGGATVEPSNLALEGYINARVFAEVLNRAGRNPTRGAFIDAAWKMRHYDLGGFEVGFTQPGRNASSFVELVMIGKEGRIVR